MKFKMPVIKSEYVLLFLIAAFVSDGFFKPFNQVRCGSNNYVVFADWENPLYSYNNNNLKMVSKFFSKDVMYDEEKNDITSLVHIFKDGSKPDWNIQKEFSLESYRYSIKNQIHFIPENNIFTIKDHENLKLCYKGASFMLEENIKTTKVSEGHYQTNGDYKFLD